jgi:hypothetical protein
MSQDAGSYTPTVGAQPQSTAQVARDEAGNVGQSVREAGGQVAQTATDQAKQVVSEASRQARDLVGEARQQARQQATSQQQKAVDGLRALADELREMAEKSSQSGLAAELAQQAADRARGLASWLEQREPGDLLEEVRAYARRHPGTFLFGAAVAGVVAGRLTRGVAASTGSAGAPSRTSAFGDVTMPPAPFADVTTTTPPARYGDVTSTVPPVSYGDVTTTPAPPPAPAPPPPPPPTATPSGDYGTAPVGVPDETPDRRRADEGPEPGYPTYGAGPR